MSECVCELFDVYFLLTDTRYIELFLHSVPEDQMFSTGGGVDASAIGMGGGTGAAAFKST